MSTIVPHHRIIDVTPEHVSELEERGLGSLLVWYERTHQVAVTEPGDVPGAEAMIIAGNATLPDLRSQAASDDEADPQEAMARILTETAEDLLFDWPDVRARTPAAADLRTDMATRSCYLVERPGHTDGGLCDTYQCLHRRDLFIAVTMPTTPTGPPLARFLNVDTALEVAGFHLGFEGPYPALTGRLMTEAIWAGVNALPRR